MKSAAPYSFPAMSTQHHNYVFWNAVRGGRGLIWQLITNYIPLDGVTEKIHIRCSLQHQIFHFKLNVVRKISYYALPEISRERWEKNTLLSLQELQGEDPLFVFLYN
jgi:hypothetical protein